MKNVSEFAGRVDREQIRVFITRSIPEQVHLVAIGQNEAIQGRYFDTDYEAAVAWAVERNQSGANMWTGVQKGPR